MKNILTICISLLFLYSCIEVENKETPNLSERRAEIDTLINNWHNDAANGNLENYFAFMDSISIYIGTDASEIWTKEEFYKFCEPYFKKETTWDFKAIERNIYLSKTNEVAWFDETLNTHMGTCRGSGVLEKTNTEWKLKHYALSVAIPNDDMRAIIDIKSVNDSIFLSQY